MILSLTAGIISNRNNAAPIRSEIVIVLKAYKAPADTYEVKKGVFYKTLDSEISIFEGSRRFSLDLEKTPTLNDTLKINPRTNTITLLIRANVFTTFDYLVNAGDTLEVSTSSGRQPIVKVINRPTRRFDQSFDSLWFKKAGYPEMTVLAMANRISLFIDYGKSPAEINKQKTYLKSVYYQLAYEEISGIQEIADSLRKINQISSETYIYITNRNRFNLMELGLPEAENALKEQFSLINNDSLVQSFGANSYFYSYLDKISDRFFAEKAQPIDLKDGVNRNYCQVFDTIAQSNIIVSSIRQYLLSREMKRIINSFSPEIYLLYFEKFKSVSTDSILIEEMKKNYFLNEIGALKELKSVTLSSSGQQSTTLDQILANNKGNVLYIDFWASWCLPCRESMKHALRLQEKYKGKKFEIIFLSIDKNAESWLKAAKAEGIDKAKGSYIVKNYPMAEFFKTVKLTSIPRYMLYDRSGKILFAEAPHPESSYLQKIIEEEIKRY